MRVYKPVNLVFLLLIQFTILVCLSFRLYAGSYYKYVNVKGEDMYFETEYPLDEQILKDEGLVLQPYSSENTEADSSVMVYRLRRDSLEVVPRSQAVGSITSGDWQRAFSDYTKDILPLIRLVIAQSVHSSFRQTSRPASEPPVDSHRVTIHIRLPGVSHMAALMENAASVANSLVSSGVATRWHAEMPSLRSPDRPVLALTLYVDIPETSASEEPDARPSTSEERATVAEAARRVRFSDVETENADNIRAEPPYAEAHRDLSEGGRLVFDVNNSANSIEAIIRRFREETSLLAIDFYESFYRNGVMYKYTPRVHTYFYPVVTTNRGEWVEDGDDQLHQIRGAAEQNIPSFPRRRESTTTVDPRLRGDDDGINLSATSLRQEFYILRIPLAHIPQENLSRGSIVLSEEAEQNEQDARYRLLPIPGFSGMIMEETRL